MVTCFAVSLLCLEACSILLLCDAETVGALFIMVAFVINFLYIYVNASDQTSSADIPNVLALAHPLITLTSCCEAGSFDLLL